jgi:transcriptional regulator with XRE-family HTH domain
VGYRGKVAERERARELRALGWTMPDIAAELGVSRGSVSSWTRDVPMVPQPRSRARRRGPNALQQAKAAEIDRLLAEGRARIGGLSERDLLIAGAALYAGEGSKTNGKVSFANSDARMVALFLTWLRTFFQPEEGRLRVRIYLHEGLDLASATAFWASVTGIPASQFHQPYRARADASIRSTKHAMGCATVVLSCSTTHRRVLGLVEALLPCVVHSGVAQLAEQTTVNR